MSAPADFAPLADAFPFADLVGPIYVRRWSDPPVIGFEPDERHTNHRDTVMGGMLATLVDLAFGMAIASEAEDAQDRATVSLTVDYLKPALAGEWIEAHTRVERVGRTIAFADCSLRVGDTEIVRARSVFAAAG